MMVKAALLPSDTDLTVSGSARGDKHFPFMINIPLSTDDCKAASRPQCGPRPGCYRLLLLTLLRDAARGGAGSSAEE